MSVQSSFNSPMERTREVLERAKRKGLDKHTLILAVSGGTDSVVAADLMCRIGPEYGFEPDAIAHINTGAAVPQSKLVAKVMAEKWDLKFIEQGYRNKRDSLAYRVLENGWPGGYAGSPATGGHGLEWANRKAKPMDAVYMMFEGKRHGCLAFVNSNPNDDKGTFRTVRLIAISHGGRGYHRLSDGQAQKNNDT